MTRTPCARTIAMLERCALYQNPTIPPAPLVSGASEWHYCPGEYLAPSDRGRDDAAELSMPG